MPVTLHSHGPLAATSRPSRRDLLRLGIAGGALALGGEVLIGPMEAEAAPPVRPAGRVRNSVYTASGAEDGSVAAYSQAVGLMKARTSSSDPLSWTYWANIHNNYCPHGNWYFLPWHREYLLAFEDVLQKHVPAATLPYWDWTARPSLPPSFRTTSSPLYSSRSSSANSGGSLPTEMTGSSVMASIYGLQSFNSFGSSMPSGQNSTSSTWQRRSGTYGKLEGTPHNYVHNWCQGNMATFLSPLDPIFWLHHANVDRIWYQWNQAHPSGNPTSSYWKGFTFASNFYSPLLTPSGGKYSVKVSEITMSSYGYASAASPGVAALQPARRESSTAAIARLPRKRTGRFRGLGGIRAGLGRPGRTRIDLGGDLAAFSTQGFLRLLDVDNPAIPNPPVCRMFLSDPATTLGPDTPITDPGYVGTIAFFGGGHHMQMVSFEAPLMDTIRNLISIGASLTSLEVQLVPVTLTADVQPVDLSVQAVEVEFI